MSSNLNIILDFDIVLDLLSISTNDTQHRFSRLQKTVTRFWLPCCLLPLVETQLSHRRPLNSLLEEVHLLSTLAAHWHEIPDNCSNKTHALISLDAAILPGITIIWTNDPDFNSVHPDIEWGDHEFVYGKLAEFECENEILFNELSTQQLDLREKLEKNLFIVLKHQQYTHGNEINAIENQLANYVGSKHCITVNNGTNALLLALMALGVKADDEIITSPYAFIATAEMIRLLGAKPVFVDIDPNTYTLNPKLIENAITPKTKAIIPVNLYGQCADFDAINLIATENHLAVIEDASQSFGSTYKNRYSCSLATIGCTSFSAVKPLGTYGNGGACFTDDIVLAETIRELRMHGQNYRYYHHITGTNSQLDSFQASVLLAKFTKFPQELIARQNVANTYTRLLKEKLIDKVKTPVIMQYNTSSYNYYTIEIENRDDIQQKLQKRDIPTEIHYPLPIHLQLAFAFLKQSEGTFNVAELVSQRVLCLPIHAYLNEETIKEIVTALVHILR